MEALNFICNIIKSDVTRNIVMIIAASTAFIVYYFNKRDNFRKAASIILLEIKEVENIISNVRTGQMFNISLPILKSNSWKEYKHFFVNKLDLDEFQQLNNFYIQAEIIENERIKVSNALTIAMEEKEKLLQKMIIELAKEYSSNKDEYNRKKNECLEIIHKEDYYFEPSVPKDRINKAIIGMQLIIITSIGTKLKKYSK